MESHLIAQHFATQVNDIPSDIAMRDNLTIQVGELSDDRPLARETPNSDTAAKRTSGMRSARAGGYAGVDDLRIEPGHPGKLQERGAAEPH